MGYPTPNNLPTERICRQIFIPDDARWLAVYNGIMSMLANPCVWEKIGTLTPEEAAEQAAEIYYQFVESECEGGTIDVDNEAVGTFKMFISASPPSAKWLPCDESEHGQLGYPALVAYYEDESIDLLNPSHGSFYTPNLSVALPMGVAASQEGALPFTGFDHILTNPPDGERIYLAMPVYWYIKALP